MLLNASLGCVITPHEFIPQQYVVGAEAPGALLSPQVCAVPAEMAMKLSPAAVGTVLCPLAFSPQQWTAWSFPLSDRRIAHEWLDPTSIIAV